MKRAILAVAILLAVAGTANAGGTALKAKANAAGTPPAVVLTWTQGTVPAGSTCPSGSGSTAVTGNVILRGTTAGGETVLATLTSPATTYTDTSVTPGTSYFYTVEAVNCTGTSGASNEATLIIPNPQAPNPPTGLTVTTQ
jgi:hypothetical protein